MLYNMPQKLTPLEKELAKNLRPKNKFEIDYKYLVEKDLENYKIEILYNLKIIILGIVIGLGLFFLTMAILQYFQILNFQI